MRTLTFGLFLGAISFAAPPAFACEELKWLRNMPIVQLVPAADDPLLLETLKKRWVGMSVSRDKIARRLEILVWRTRLRHLAEQEHPLLEALGQATELTGEALIEFFDYLPRPMLTRTLLEPRADAIGQLAREAKEIAFQLGRSPSKVRVEIADYLDSLATPIPIYVTAPPAHGLAHELAKNYGEDLLEILSVWRTSFPAQLTFQDEVSLD